MNAQFKEIGDRLTDLREINEISVEKMAAQLGVTPEEYRDYEAGNTDFSISFLCNAAAILGVEIQIAQVAQQARNRADDAPLEVGLDEHRGVGVVDIFVLGIDRYALNMSRIEGARSDGAGQ